MKISDVFCKFGKAVVVAGVIAFTHAAQAQHRDGGRPEGGHPGTAPPHAAPHQEPAHRPEPARPFTPAPAVRPGAEHHAVVRVDHGSIRHANAPVIRNENVIVHNDVRNFPRHVDRDFDREHFSRRRFLPGAFFVSLPIGVQTVFANNTPYYYSDGLYYQQAPNGYQQVYAPVGAIVPALPVGAVPIVIGYATYFYADGTFYVQEGNQFAVVQPPLGITVPELPSAAVQVALNGQIAYLFNGVYYMPIFVNGVTQYTVVQPPG
jgi:Family of unknown function (DUF6515)